MADITLKDLRFTRPDFKLTIEQLHIRQGEKIALMGENGCGKSTLIGLMTGLLDKGEGEVCYQGNKLSAISHTERAKQFAVLPQFSDISFPFTVFEVVRMGRFVHINGNQFSDTDDQQSEKLLELLDLIKYRDKSYAELSGGEKKRVMLARVLNQQAPVIYLDEPNSSLDIRHTLEIFQHLGRLPQTVITSVHDINLAYRYFDRFLFFKQGTLLHDVSRSQITSQLLSEVYDVSVTTDTDSFSFQPR